VREGKKSEKLKGHILLAEHPHQCELNLKMAMGLRGLRDNGGEAPIFCVEKKGMGRKGKVTGGKEPVRAKGFQAKGSRGRAPCPVWEKFSPDEKMGFRDNPGGLRYCDSGSFTKNLKG